MTAIDTTVELAAPTNLLNPPRFSPVVVTPAIVTPEPTCKFPGTLIFPSESTTNLSALPFVVS